jgi:hypothetical protein
MQNFVANHGQWPSQVKFLSRTPGLDLWVTDGSVVYDLYRTQSSKQSNRQIASSHRIGHVVRMQFVGASEETAAQGYEQKPGYFNYIYGNRSISNVPVFAQARIEKLYKGVDAVLYLDNGRPRYDLVLQPGADVAAINVKYDGAKGVRVNDKGELAISTSIGEVTQSGLFAYQMDNGIRKQVACSFAVGKNGAVGFKIGAYDASRPLVIDPVISTLGYSTFFGGVGDDAINGMAVDGANNVYVAGACSTAVFPTTPGAYDVTQNGGIDAFVAKLDSAGTNLLYSTFLGGSSDDMVRALALGPDNSVVIAGNTLSNNFPTTANAYDASYNGLQDAFLARLSANGTSLLYSTYFGGTDNDVATSVAIGAKGNWYLAGYTSSTNFPTSVGGFKTTYGTNSDGFVAKINTDGSLNYSTYLGGSAADSVNGLAVDADGNAYATGVTFSTNYPTTSNGLDLTYNGAGDAFVTKISSTGGALVYSTFVGGTNLDNGAAITLDGNRSAHVAGMTASSDFPTSITGYDRGYNGGAADAFIARLNPQGSVLNYSTFVGGNGYDAARAIVLDQVGSVYITGLTTSSAFPTTVEAYDQSYHTGNDVFVTKLHMGDAVLGYSTYLGASGNETGNAIAMRDSDNIYVAGVTSSIGFPTAGIPYDGSYNGSNDGFITKIRIHRLDLTEFMRRVRWCQDRVYPITFTSSNVQNIEVRLSSDGGFSYPTQLIASTPAQPGVYPWLVNQGPGVNYRIKIIDVDHPNLFDIGDSLFTIVARQQFTSGPLPSIRTVCARDTTSFRVRTNGTGVRYQWVKNGLPIPGATDSVYFIYAAHISDTGYYRVVITDTCGNVDSTDVNGPGSRLLVTESATITAQPTSQNPCPNSPATFTVTATGAGLKYQWRKNNQDIQGATNATYTIPAATQNDVATYSVVISGTQCNPNLGIESNRVTLRINTDSVTILRAPESQDKCTGQKVTFAAVASGSGLTFQWRKNGTPIAGATSSTYSIDSVKMDDAGRYTVAINGPCAGTGKESSEATLTVYESPTITVQPVRDIAVKKGAAINLTVTATGTALKYQWRKNGTDITGATSATYTIPASDLPDNGQYDVQITGQCGQIITSQVSTVIIDTTTGGVPMIFEAQSMRMTFMPNPTNGQTVLAINPPLRSFEAAGVEIGLYNVLGQKVMDLTSGLTANHNSVSFDATGLPAGLYYCRVANASWGMSNVVLITK